MQKRLFDLHCDTLYEARRQGKSLAENDLCISFDKLRNYDGFVQILAVWSEPDPTEDQVYERFFEAKRLLDSELSSAPDILLCRSDAGLSEAESAGKNAVFLAVEGGRLLSDKPERLDELYDSGVRFLTLVWNKTCKIGGAFDTDEGLSDFGRGIVRRCFELGIIPDVSHASDRMCGEVIGMAKDAGKVAIATHSNSRSVCDHRRNLTDERFRAISSLGGIVGISLAPMHLTADYLEKCDIDDVVRHIEHYLSLDGENTVCLGCDLDGVSRLPDGISDVSDLTKIADRLARINYNDTLIDKIFYKNARDFISRWL